DDCGVLGRQCAGRLPETDSPSRFPRRVDQLAERGKHMLEIVIVSGHSMFECIQLCGQVGMSTTNVAKADECTDDEYAHAHRAGAVDYRRCHQRTMFGEGPGHGRRELQILKAVTICDHLMALRRGELQPEIPWKPANIAFD